MKKAHNDHGYSNSYMALTLSSTVLSALHTGAHHSLRKVLSLPIESKVLGKHRV